MKLKTLTLVLIILTVGVSAAAEKQDKEYFAVLINGEKAGHGTHSRVVEDVTMTIKRGGIAVTTHTIETSIETTDGEPLGFEALQDMSMMKMRMEGTVSDGMVNVTVKSPTGSNRRSFQWPEGAVMAEGMRLLALEKGLKEGTEFTAKVFSLMLMDAVETEISIGEVKEVELINQTQRLREMTTEMVMPGAGRLVTKGYVDDQAMARKQIVNMMGLSFEMVACSKEIALSENNPIEILTETMLKSPRPLDPENAEAIRYRLSVNQGQEELGIPSDDNQTVRKLENGDVLITIEPTEAPASVPYPYQGSDEQVLEWLKSGNFVQSDDPRIKALAEEAVGDAEDAAQAAKNIEAFVADYIDRKGLSVGYASATEILENRSGDCSEFAVLTCSLLRAAGIPAQMVVGIAYVDEFAGLNQRFGGHAWCRAYIGGKWVGLDAAFTSAGLGGYGPGHIAQAYGGGELADFLGILNSLGRFEIAQAKVIEKGSAK